MKWSCAQLNRTSSSPLSFSVDLDFTEEAKTVTGLFAIAPAHVHGTIHSLGDDAYELAFTLDVELTVGEARTWEPIVFPLHVEVDEIEAVTPENDDERPIENGTVDLSAIVWECIILNKPIRVTKEQESR